MTVSARMRFTRIAAGTAAVAALVAAAVGAALPAGAATVRPLHVRATLDGAHVVPHVGSAPAKAGGSFVATIDGEVLYYRLVFHGLSGRAMTAQIHSGGPKAAGPLVQPLCVPCLSPESGALPLAGPQLAALRAGRLYVSIQTDAAPDGEIRGQLALVK